MKKATTYLATCILLLCLYVNGYSQNEVQRVRINFETPEGFVRHLLLGFTPDNAATDGFDYGYDAPNIEDHPHDMNWMIEDNRYVIQGVGAFDTTKAYPLGIFMSSEGSVSIALTSLENFPEPINVFIFDVENNSFHQINYAPFSFDIASGEYPDSYYITFSTNVPYGSTLSLNDLDKDPFSVSYNNYTEELTFRSENNHPLDKIEIYNELGQLITQMFDENQSQMVIPVRNVASRPLIARIQSDQNHYIKRLLPH